MDKQRKRRERKVTHKKLASNGIQLLSQSCCPDCSDQLFEQKQLIFFCWFFSWFFNQYFWKKMYPKMETQYSDRDSLLLTERDKCSGLFKFFKKLFILVSGILLGLFLTELIYGVTYAFSGINEKNGLLSDACFIQLPLQGVKYGYVSWDWS